jgi:hypothetical protein
MPGIGGFTLTQDDDEFLVGLGTKPTETVVHGGKALGMEEGDFSQFPEVLNNFFESAVQIGDGAVDMGLYRKRLGGGLWVGFGLRLMLREVDRAFSFIRSHRCLPKGSVG